LGYTADSHIHTLRCRAPRLLVACCCTHACRCTQAVTAFCNLLCLHTLATVWFCPVVLWVGLVGCWIAQFCVAVGYTRCRITRFAAVTRIHARFARLTDTGCSSGSALLDTVLRCRFHAFALFWVPHFWRVGWIAFCPAVPTGYVNVTPCCRIANAYAPRIPHAFALTTGLRPRIAVTRALPRFPTLLRCYVVALTFTRLRCPGLGCHVSHTTVGFGFLLLPPRCYAPLVPRLIVPDLLVYFCCGTAGHCAR